MPTGLLLDQGTELINKVMRIDYEGTVNVTMATLPKMIARGKGDLINFASIAGWIPTPHFGAYNAAKFAVVAFSEVLYHENRGKGVRFACVCPPPVATPLLEQATSKPKSLDTFEPIEPDHVLDEIERHLESGELFVFPNSETRRAVRMRRWFPNLIWSRVHKLEGLP
jgi:short-subunit dehydrogenase